MFLLHVIKKYIPDESKISEYKDQLVKINTKLWNLENAKRAAEKTGEFGEKFINDADVGMIGVNVGICAPHPYLPFGGIKGSLVGNNKVQGKDAVDFFTQNKTATVRVVNPKGNDATPTKPADTSVRSCVAD